MLSVLLSRRALVLSGRGCAAMRCGAVRGRRAETEARHAPSRPLAAHSLNPIESDSRWMDGCITIQCTRNAIDQWTQPTLAGLTQSVICARRCSHQWKRPTHTHCTPQPSTASAVVASRAHDTRKDARSTMDQTTARDGEGIETETRDDDRSVTTTDTARGHFAV